MKPSLLPKATENWSSEGGRPVSEATAAHVTLLIDHLPEHLRPQDKDIQPDPDGGVSVFWTTPQGRAILTVSDSAFSFWARAFPDLPIKAQSGYANPPSKACIRLMELSLEKIC